MTSNLLHGDYAGSESCRPCHAELFEKFDASPMHQMTRDVATHAPRAAFAGEALRLGADRATLETHDERRFVRIVSSRGEALFRVTKIIGGRYREDFAGVEVMSTRAGAGAVDHERVLPVSWLRFNQTWRYKGYSVMTPERPALKAGSVWRKTCMFCHNTPPGLSLFYDELHGPDAPKYQGRTRGELPPERELRWRVTDGAALGRAIDGELKRIEAEPGPEDSQRLLAHAAVATRRHFREEHLVELGIGCEACHGGSRQHVAEPALMPSFAPEAEFLSVTTSSGKPLSYARQVNRSCARCHTVLFTQYPHTWEGKSRAHEPGGSHINSGEARDFILGGCSSQLHCASCHDAHAEDSRAQLARFEQPKGDALCLRCHEKLAGDAALEAHSHHPAQSSGARCVGCHMPRKNMNLAYGLTRYHRIGSPTDAARVEGDRPLECALCHTDKSVGTLVADMERWWGKRYDRGRLRRLYGNLKANPIAATLKRGLPHEQAVAAAVAGRDGLRRLESLLIGLLTGEYPLVRFYALHALEQLRGERLEVDWHLPGPELARAVETQLKR